MTTTPYLKPLPDISEANRPFWEALQQLCAAAGLVESSAATAPGAAKKGKAAAPVSPQAAPAIHLTAGTPAELPTSYAGSVRVRLLRVMPQAGGAIDLVLEVAPEARLRGLGAAGGIVVTRAVDERDQVLTMGTPVTPPSQKAAKRADALAANLKASSSVTEQLNGSGPFQITLRLEPGEQPLRRLKELMGKFTNSRFFNVVAWGTTVIMVVLTAAMLWTL